MTLNAEQRAQLLNEANKLRSEVSALTSERDAAFSESAQANADAKLLAEVMGLQRQRDEAARQRDAAVNSTGDAVLLMEEAIQRQADIAAAQNAGSSEPDRTGQQAPDINTENSDADNTRAADKPEAVDSADGAEKIEPTPARASATDKNKGGNR